MFAEKNLGKQNLDNFLLLKKTIFQKLFFKLKKLETFLQLQVTIPSAHPVQISRRSDYSYHSVIMWYHTKKLKKRVSLKKKGSGNYCRAPTRFF